MNFFSKFIHLFILFTFFTPTTHAIETHPNLHFIDTSFENASPLYWEVDEEQRVHVYLVYDQERNSPNRANGHFYFRLEGEPGSDLMIVLNNLQNVWNGKPGNPLSERSICKVSTDQRHWETVPLSKVSDYQYQVELTLEKDFLYVAHVEPYTISDLENFIDEITDHPLVSVETIGETVQGRPIELIQVGDDSAPHHVLIRTRSHPWEPGGNWVVQGLVRSLLSDDSDNEQYLESYYVSIIPMINKDGVANGMTRFNVRGMDLNRNWDQPADPELAPENAAIEAWLSEQIDQGKKPDFAFDLHNDQSGRIHISRPNIDLEHYLAVMERYERLMREHTWFTEGSTGGQFRNPGTFGEGLLERFGITAFVQELNSNWIAGLDDYASGANWELLGSQYREVFYRFFKDAPSP